MAVLPVGIGSEVGAGGYQISRSLRFNSADSAYLNRTFGTATNTAKWTFNRWIKRGAIGARQSLFAAGSSGSSYANIEFKADDTIQFLSENSAVQFQLVTTQVFRDPSGWYNIHIIYDSANATSTDRIQLWVNGIRVTAFSTATYPSSPSNLFNTAIDHQIGVLGYASTAYFSGYLAEVHFIDGQALTPTSFGEFNSDTGVWQPKAYTGSYGTNGFYLDFSDNSGTTSTTLGADSSGNGNNWTPNNFSVTAGAGNDSLVDSPTRYGTDTGAGGTVRGNYATLNPLNNPGGSTLSNGNLDVTTASSGNGRVSGTVSVSSGKWYWEVTPTNLATNGFIGIGSANEYTATYPGGTATSYGYLDSTGNKYNNGVATAYGASYTTNDVIGVALDLDAGTLVFYKNGVSQGTAFSSLSGSFVPALGDGGTGTSVFVCNFGQRPFAYTAPSGFKALCTTNLPEPTIADGGEYFNTVLYTGNATARSITGVGFRPDFVWLKSRSNTYNHGVFDVIRGPSAALYPSLTNAETTESGVTSFDSDGFSLGTSNGFNLNNGTMVAWNWKANGAGVSNTDGTITSTVSANTDSGFSIVTYTGTGAASGTIGHGLSAVPSMIITKKRSSGGTDYGWSTYHKSIGSSNIWLDKTNAQNPGNWPTPPTTTVFTHAVLDYNNVSGETYVNYVFAEIAGYSAFGSYTGNGSADGPFVYTGFRPRWIMFKIATSIPSGYGDWYIHDTVRNTINPVNSTLSPNTSAAENANNSSLAIDALSNGFKVRVSYQDLNNSGSTIIYAAFAENPFAYSLAR